MKREQLAYAKRRINEIWERHRDKISVEDFTIKAVKFTQEEKLEAFEAGEFTLAKDAFRSSYQNVGDCIVFDGEKKEVFDRKAYQDAIDALGKIKEELLDDLVFSENLEVLNRINEFANYNQTGEK